MASSIGRQIGKQIVRQINILPKNRYFDRHTKRIDRLTYKRAA